MKGPHQTPFTYEPGRQAMAKSPGDIPRFQESHRSPCITDPAKAGMVSNFGAGTTRSHHFLCLLPPSPGRLPQGHPKGFLILRDVDLTFPS